MPFPPPPHAAANVDHASSGGNAGHGGSALAPGEATVSAGAVATPPAAGTGAAPLLSVRNLRIEFPHRRGTLVAIDGVSFDVARGEVLGVVGESGAGKSLTGAAIIGLLEPPGRIAAGQVLLHGEPIHTLPPEKMRRIRGRRIAMIFQDPLTSLNPLFTVGQQITETILTHRDISEKAARKRAIELLAEVGIPAPDQRVDHYPHQFSGGMRQRVVIALALCAEPELIIADEPTTALDVSVQAQIITLLKKLCREHHTAVMLVTHDMGVIAETADRVAVMYAGRLAEIGPVRAVVQNPQHPYTRGLMGSIPVLGADVHRLVQIEGAMPRLNAIPPGCAFNPRCPHVFARCHSERPDLLPAQDTLAACWLYAHPADQDRPGTKQSPNVESAPRAAGPVTASAFQGLTSRGSAVNRDAKTDTDGENDLAQGGSR